MADIEKLRRDRERRAQQRADEERTARRIKEDQERARRARDTERRRIQLMAIKQQEEKKEAEIRLGELKSKDLIKELEAKKKARLIQEQEQQQQGS